MIIALRKSLKSKAFKIVFWIVIITASGALSVFEFVRLSFFGKSENKWVLQVNHHKVFGPELDRSIADQQERIRIMRAQYGQYADLYFQMMGMSLNPQELAQNALIRKALLNDVANALPLYISADMAQTQLNDPALITQEISDLVPFFTWDPSLNGVNPLALQMYLQQVGVSADHFNYELAQAVKRHELQKLVGHTAYVPEFELKDDFAQKFLGHKFSVALIPAQDMLAQVKKEAITDESLKAFFDRMNTQEKRYSVPEKRSAKIITFDPSHYGISISDQEVEKYYNNNKAQFVEQPAQVQVRHILLKVSDPAQEKEIQQKAEKLQQELVKNPAEFAAQAKGLSEDSKTAAQGGLMPYFSKGQHDKTFEKTSFLLKEDGSVSSVIRTKDGFEIIQRVGKKMQTFKPISQVAKDIKDVLMKKQFSQRFASDIRAVLNQPDSQQALEKFAKEKQAKETVSKDVAADNSILAKTMFRLKDKETSFYQDANQGVAVTITEIKKSSVPSLNEIKNQVKEDYYKEQAEKKLADRLDAIKKVGASLESFKDGLKLEKTGWIRHSHEYKDDMQEKQELQKKGFDLGKMFQLENKGGVITYEQNGNGYIIRLDEIAPFNQELFDQKKSTLLSELGQQKKSLIMAGFVASLYRNAKIIKNDLKSS